NSELLVKLEEYTREKGYYLLLGTTENNPEVEAEVIEKLIRKNIDALVVVPGNYSNEAFYRQVIEQHRKNKTPAVFIGSYYKNILANYVALDLETAFYNLTNYLFSKVEKGNILFFGGHPDEYYTRVRLKGIKKAFDENGKRFPEKNQINIGTGYTMQNGYRAINNFLKKKSQKPEAIIGLNDLVAFGIIKGLKEHAIMVPDDVLVTGCDDIYLPAMEDYNLTTLRIPVEEMAKFTIDAVMNNLSNTKLSLQQQITLQLDIVKRKTA
ncbi:MAG: substrate-binding domain-containing protein, partial [Prolixibacteraceae bacterium]